MNRQAALKAGARFYVGRQPCRRCGGTTRYVANRACRDCESRRWNDEGHCARAASRWRDQYHRGRRAIAILKELGIEI